MKVSIIVPVHNKAPWLKECFDSIFAQTFRDFEVIAVDDRSTDDSLAVLRGMSDPRLKVVPLEHNLGPAGAAQRATDLATGEYVARMDADDVMFPDRLAEQVRFMDDHPGIGVSGAHLHLLGTGDQVQRASLTDEECRAGILFQIPIFQPVSIYRRSVLVEHDVRFEDSWPRYGEDWFYQARLLEVTHLANIDKPLLHYRVGDQNTRTGRDRSGDLKVLYEGLFKHYGWPFGPAEMRAHFHAVRWFPEPLRPGDVHAVAAHLAHLLEVNKERGTFPEPGFARRVQRAWDELAYRLPPFGAAVMLAYLRHDRSWSRRKIRYMLASWLRGRS